MTIPSPDLLRAPLWDIKRTSEVDNMGTVGMWEVQGYPICLSLEPSLRDPNQEGGDSSIAAQTYLVEWIKSPKHDWTYRLADVAGRTVVNIHIGNKDADTDGCILPGSSVDYWKGTLAVAASRVAYDGLFAATAAAAGWPAPDMDDLGPDSMPPLVRLRIHAVV